MEEAALPGGVLGPDTPHSLTLVQKFSLKNQSDLLAECPLEDVQEVEETVMQVLTELAGESS